MQPGAGRYGAPLLTGAEPQRIMPTAQTTKKGLQKGARHYQLAVCRHDTSAALIAINANLGLMLHHALDAQETK